MNKCRRRIAKHRRRIRREWTVKHYADGTIVRTHRDWIIELRPDGSGSQMHLPTMRANPGSLVGITAWGASRRIDRVTLVQG